MTYKLDKQIKKNHSDELLWNIHEFGLDPGINHIYLFGNEELANLECDWEPGVEYTMANKFIRNLNYCMRRNDGEPILIHMKTNGGHWAEGMAIYDAIMACPSKVTILNYTHARSMSSIILQAADKRVMMPNSTFMFHDGTFTFEGTIKQLFTETKEVERASAIMMKIYVDRLKEKGKLKNWSRKRIEEWLRSEMDRKEEVYMTAEQAVQYGFADMVFGNGTVGYDWSKLFKY